MIYDIEKLPGEAVLFGRIDLFGVRHYAHMIEVKCDEDDMQQPVNDPFGRFLDLIECDENASAFSTVKVPGFEGDYVILITPGEA